MQVVGDEAFDVFSPSVIENLVAGLGEWAGGERAVLVSGLGDDGQLAERAWPVGVGSECLLAVMLAAQADEVPLDGGASEFGLQSVEREDVVNVAILCVHVATGVAAGAVT